MKNICEASIQALWTNIVRSQSDIINQEIYNY